MQTTRWLVGIVALMAGAQLCATPLEPGDTVVIVTPETETSATRIAVERISDYTSASVKTVSSVEAAREAKPDIVVQLGIKKLPELDSARQDAYAVKSLSTTGTITVAASGTNDRSMLYAAYRLADMLKSGDDLSSVALVFEPKINERYVSFGATTHGRRHYRPELYWKTLNELPRYGYNGVIIYPGGGTPIGRNASPLVESKSGHLGVEAGNSAKWKEWLFRIDSYGLDIMMTVPPSIPPGYEMKDIREYYSGGPEPENYLKNLKANFRTYLELLTREYPDSDFYMFNSTEGATFGRNQRFFGHPAPEKYPVADYLKNNEAVMTAYFEVLTDFFGTDINKVMFWTHSFGLSSDGIRKMREILFRYPEVTIIEDDFWNNNLWPHDLPAMAYLPDDLRKEVSEKNPYALFQIATDGEYYGGGSLPNAYPDSHVRSAQDALERDARMVIQRLDLHDRTPYGTAFGTVEIVPFAASRQLWKPAASTEELWKEWAERRFGKDAAPDVTAALQESKTILHKGLSCNGIHLLGVGSEFMPRMWMKDDTGVTRFFLFGKPGRDLVPDDDPEVTSEEYSAYQMDSHSIAIREWRINQEEARQAVERGLQRIQKARGSLDPADYEMLEGIYVNGQNVLKAIRLLGEAAYATNIMLENFDNVADPLQQFDKAISELETYIEDSALIPEMKTNLQKIADHYKDLAKQ